MSKDTSKQGKKKKPKFAARRTIFLDDSSDSSDSSVGSFLLKRNTDMKRGNLKRDDSPKKLPPKEVVTPEMMVVHGRSSATAEEDYNYGREDTTKTSRMMDVTHLKRTWTKVINLTGTSGEPELPGPRLQDIKEANNVYWTYDPRGVPNNKIDTAYYCTDCKCPFHYCAKITFGAVVTTQVEYLIKEEKPDLTYDWLELKFRGVYWTCVHHKMMINKIPFPDGYNFPSFGALPACIELVYLRRLFRKYGEVCDSNRGKVRHILEK
jgi:hypothetical protein